MNGRDSSLLHFAMLDGLTIEYLWEPVEEWVQDEGSDLSSR